MTKFSIVIPVYNAEKTLRKCIDSVRRQRYEDWERIAIDDGSIDNSYNILLEYKEMDRRIKAYTQSNQGPGITRNNGISIATGDYIVFLDSDDYISDDYLSNAFKPAQKNYDVMYINVVQEKEDGTIISEERLTRFEKYSKDEIIAKQMTGVMPWGGVRKIAKLAFLKHNNIKFSKDVIGEEAIYSFDLLYFAEKYCFLDGDVYHYVNYPQSQSKKGGYESWIPIAKKMKKHLISIGVYEHYKNAVSSFGYSALIAWLRRYSRDYGIRETLREFRKKYNEYSENYAPKVDLKSIRKELVAIYPLIRMRFLFLVVLMMKIYNICRT